MLGTYDLPIRVGCLASEPQGSVGLCLPSAGITGVCYHAGHLAWVLVLIVTNTLWTPTNESATCPEHGICSRSLVF